MANIKRREKFKDITKAEEKKKTYTQTHIERHIYSSSFAVLSFSENTFIRYAHIQIEKREEKKKQNKTKTS